MNLGMGILSTKSVGSLSPSAIGVIYDKTLGDNIADWTLTKPSSGISFTPSGTDYIMAGANSAGSTPFPALFQDYIQLNTTDHAFTCLNKWKIRIEFTTGTVNASDSYGFAAGVISTNAFENRDTLCRVAQDNGLLGRMYFYAGDTASTGITGQDAPTGGYTVTSSTRYLQEIERNELTLTSTLYASDGVTVRNTKTVTQSPPGGTVSKVLHNTGKFAIMQIGGTNTIHRVTISSDALKNVPYCIVTTSIGYGGKATSLANSFPYIALDGQDFTILPGWANTTLSMQDLLPEIIAINPTNLIIECGSNDIKDGTWTSDGLPSLNNIISGVSGINPTIYLVSAGARDDVSTAQVETDMIALGYPLCRAYTLLKNPANTTLNNAYQAADGIHLNDDGHALLANDGTYGLKVILGL